METINTIEKADLASVKSISSGAMLAEVNISQFSGRKKDKKASQEVTDANGAKRGVASVHKALLGDCKELSDVHKFAANARNQTHYHLTMPWSDSGWRLLTTAAYFDYHQCMTAAQTEFYRLVDIFINNYSWEITKAQVDLGGMFNPNEYPSEEELRAKFSFRINYMPVPENGDFRLDIGNEANAEMNDQYKEFYEDQLKKAVNDVWERLYKKLVHFAERLDYGEHDRKKIFKEGTVNGLLEVVDLLDILNVTGDSNMTMMKNDLDKAMQGVTPEALREDHILRAQTKRKMDAAIKTLPTLM